MRVLFLDRVHPILEERLVASGYTTEQDYTSKYRDIVPKLAHFDGIVIRSRIKIDQHLLESARHLKFIARSGAGLENIDLEAAKKLGIEVFNSPEGNRDAVGEHTVAMLLAFLNNIKRADLEVRIGRWFREQNRGYELGALTVGIIGYGNTGQAFARKLSGFGCKVLAYDKYNPIPNDKFAENCSLEELKAEADVVSLHIPLTDETRYMINAKFIESMPKRFILINTARGPIVDTAALIAGLKKMKVWGACLDVLEFEEGSFEALRAEELPDSYHQLCNNSNVVLTPHVAGWTQESYFKLSSVLADKILARFNK